MSIAECVAEQLGPFRSFASLYQLHSQCIDFVLTKLRENHDSIENHRQTGKEIRSTGSLAVLVLRTAQ